MPTNTQATTARVLPWRMLHTLDKTITYSDTGISTGIPMPNYIPAGYQIVATYVNVVTAFNAATTNVLTVGQNSSSYNDIVSASDVTEGNTGMQIAYTGGALSITTDVLPYVKFTQTGTPATTGKARIVIVYG